MVCIYDIYLLHSFIHFIVIYNVLLGNARTHVHYLYIYKCEFHRTETAESCKRIMQFKTQREKKKCCFVSQQMCVCYFWLFQYGKKKFILCECDLYPYIYTGGINKMFNELKCHEPRNITLPTVFNGLKWSRKWKTIIK